MRGWGIARRLFLVHCVFIALLTVLVGTIAYVDARDRGYRETADRMLSVAVAIADNPLVVIAAQSSDPTAALQGYTRAVSDRADIDVISIMSPAGVRWTHPDDARIGESHPGQVAAAAGGRALTEVSPGVGGPTVRALVPILDSDGAVVGLVAAEEETSTTQTVLDARLPAILALALLLLLASSVSLWHLSRYLRRATLGWGPQELAHQFQNTDSALRAAREGLLLVNRRGILVLCTDRAAELLGIPPRQGNRSGSAVPHLSDLDLPAGLSELIAGGRPVRNEVHTVKGRVLLVSQDPAPPSAIRGRSRSAPTGSVTILRDALDGVGSIDEPVLGALVLAKTGRALAVGVRLTVRATASLTGTGVPVQVLVARIGTLLDAAVDAAAGAAPARPAPADPAPADPAPAGAAPRWVDVAIRTDPELPALVLEVTGSALPAGTSTPDPAKPARLGTIPLPSPGPDAQPAAQPVAAPKPADTPPARPHPSAAARATRRSR